MARILPPDLELWLCTYLRGILDVELGPGTATVSNKEPGTYTGPTPLVVIRSDGGPADDTYPGQWYWQVGVSVLAGASRQDDQPANDIACHVLAILTEEPEILLADGSPITKVSAIGGITPIREEHDTARRYMTVEYHVVGTVQ